MWQRHARRVSITLVVLTFGALNAGLGQAATRAVRAPAGPAAPYVLVAHRSHRTLAFTGFDVWKLILAGALCVGAAGGTWRLAHRVGCDAADR